MKSARLYQCDRCHCQCVICSDCDRGNIYCGSFCARQSRIKHHRIANGNYQKTFSGSQKHALRQRDYRLRQKQKAKKVTDQGSALLPPHDLLLNTKNDTKEIMCCHFCANKISPYLRNDYLRYYTHHQKNKFIYFRDTG